MQFNLHFEYHIQTLAIQMNLFLLLMNYAVHFSFQYFIHDESEQENIRKVFYENLLSELFIVIFLKK